VRTKWDFWSLGMMLVEMLTGRHPFAGLNDQIIGMRLSTGNVDQLVEGVGDAAWRKLCRGLLRRDPRQRWGKAEIDRWLLNPRDPKLVVAEEIALGRPGFAFMGNDYRSKEDLAANFARNWDVAKGIWQSRNKQLRDWLMHDLGHSDVVNQLERIDKTPGLDLDAQLFSVIHILDPQAPLSFRGLELTEAKLTMLADRSPNDTMAGELLRALFRSRILHLFEKLPNGDKIATIGKAWQEAVGEYERLRYEISSADYTAHVPALDDERLTILLAATTSRNVVIESLRTRARVASTPDAHECKWFEILGNPETAQSAALLHMAISGVAAAEHTKSRRAREVQQAAERRRLEAEAAAARRDELQGARSRRVHPRRQCGDGGRSPEGDSEAARLRPVHRRRPHRRHAPRQGAQEHGAIRP
jgi:hypothetical protein